MGHPDWKSETRNPFVRLLVQVSGTLGRLVGPASQPDCIRTGAGRLCATPQPPRALAPAHQPPLRRCVRSLLIPSFPFAPFPALPLPRDVCGCSAARTEHAPPSPGRAPARAVREGRQRLPSHGDPGAAHQRVQRAGAGAAGCGGRRGVRRRGLGRRWLHRPGGALRWPPGYPSLVPRHRHGKTFGGACPGGGWGQRPAAGGAGLLVLLVPTPVPPHPRATTPTLELSGPSSRSPHSWHQARPN
jgi:hypothetical protein